MIAAEADCCKSFGRRRTLRPALDQGRPEERNVEMSNVSAKKESKHKRAHLEIPLVGAQNLQTFRLVYSR